MISKMEIEDRRGYAEEFAKMDKSELGDWLARKLHWFSKDLKQAEIQRKKMIERQKLRNQQNWG
jgi:hypothetical protein